MLINFDEKLKVFTLKCKSFSYIFYINHLGILVKLHFGEHLSKDSITEELFEHLNNLNADCYSYYDLKNNEEVINNNPYFSGLTSELEAPSFMSYDKRGGLINILHSDGSSITEFRYTSHKIIDGKPSIYPLPQFDNKKVKTLEITLKDQKDDIYLKMYYSVYKDLDIIIRHNEIINNTNKTIEILEANSICLDLPTLDYDLLSVYGTYATDRILERQKLTHNIVKISDNAGGKGFYHNPMCMVVRPNTTLHVGEAIGLGLVYSSNFEMNFIGNPLNKTRILAGISKENFKYRLKKGKKFVTPEAILSYSNSGINGITHAFHDAIRAHLLREIPNFENTILLNSWEALGMEFDTEKILKQIEKASECGINLFVLDDGWFGKRNTDTCSLGDWEVNLEKIDLNRVIDFCHKKNMKFGLWIEPEMISFDSELYRSNPTFALFDDTTSGPTTLRHQFVLDMTSDKVINTIFEKISNIFDNYKIDYCKWDFNRMLTESYSRLNKEKNSYIYHAFILGTYKLLHKFIKRYPHILLETCSGGGGRFDLGMLYFSPQIWASDETDGVMRSEIQYATNVFYPLKVIGSHVSARKFLSIKEKAAIALFGTFGYELDVTKLNNEELNEIKISNDWFKKYKKLIDEGDYYSLISPYNNNFVAWEVANKNKSDAIVFFMNYKQVNWGDRFLKIYGLDDNKYYKNDLDNNVYKGEVYRIFGLNLSCGRQNFTPSLIYIYEAKK